MLGSLLLTAGAARGGLGLGDPFPAPHKGRRGLWGGARCLQDGAKQQRQGKCSVGSYLGPIPTWDGEGGHGEDTLGAGGGSVGPGLGPQKLRGAGEQPQALVLQLLAGWDTAPQPPQKICAVRAGRWGPGSPGGAHSGLGAWHFGAPASSPSLLCKAQLQAGAGAGPCVLEGGDPGARDQQHPASTPPGTNQGTEGEGTRGGWCEGSSELSLRWRGWGKAQRPPHRPPGEHPAQCKGILKKRGGLWLLLHPSPAALSLPYTPGVSKTTAPA